MCCLHQTIRDHICTKFADTTWDLSSMFVAITITMRGPTGELERTSSYSTTWWSVWTGDTSLPAEETNSTDLSSTSLCATWDECVAVATETLGPYTSSRDFKFSYSTTSERPTVASETLGFSTTSCDFRCICSTSSECTPSCATRETTSNTGLAGRGISPWGIWSITLWRAKLKELDDKV